MRTKDWAEKQTDDLLEELEDRIYREYKTALKEMQKKYDDFALQFAEEDKKKRKAVDNGEIAEKDYQKWRQDQLLYSKRCKQLISNLSQDLAMVDQKVMSITNGYMPEAYAMNFNYSTYEIEKETNLNTSFTLYSRETVERLIADNPKLLPTRKIPIPEDQKWNEKHINSAILQSILQGDKIDTIADRLQQVTDMDRRAAIRNARTMMTGAQNSGRLDAYERAARLGIKIQKEWLATLDSRTRDSHASMDGERVDWDKPFSNKLMFPGDPDGAPHEVYNCRCAMVPFYPEYPDTDLERYDQIAGKPIKYATYKEWTNSKKEPTQTVIQGKDISTTWQRRTDKFDFEIEDVINAQGFDGLPRVVSADEFDEYVKQANGGNGFIAQRTYSAPDQETLDAYRDMLYNGKWYVDCSTGGAQYGQGMYCAADYNGELTNGIRSEMKHYISQYTKLGRELSYVETFTLDPSAKIINYRDVRVAYAKAVFADIELDSKTQKIFDRYLDELGKVGGVSTKVFDWRKKIVSYVMRKYNNDMAIAYKVDDALKMNHDIGILATKLGYDAVNAKGHGDSGSYTVILNRTKVIFKGE